ncbi:MAG: PKD domain-containing protein [Saprospiraceae bacterium]
MFNVITDPYADGRNVNYSVVSVPNGPTSGNVLQKNIPLIVDTLTFGHLTAVKHGNGRDWWLIIPEEDTNRYYTWLLSPSGVSTPTLQIAGDSLDSGLGMNFFSPNGSKYIRVEQRYINQPGYVAVFDFDRCTGQLSNMQKHTFPDIFNNYGGAVSYNSRYLYVMRSTTIVQFDLLADDIFASEILVAESDLFISGFAPPWFHFAQAGPDGRIYITTAGGRKHLNYINFPNRQGEDCKVIQHGISMEVYNLTIPNFPNFRLGPLDDSSCDTLGLNNHPSARFRWEPENKNLPLRISFTDLSAYEPDEWLWDFGDGTTSQDTNPVHNFPSAGLFNVCLTVSNAYNSSTFCLPVNLEDGGIGVSSKEAFASSASFLLSPNPANASVQLWWAKPTGFDQTLTLVDSKGMVVQTHQIPSGQQQVEIDVQMLPNGIYWIRFGAANGYSEFKKLVVLH